MKCLMFPALLLASTAALAQPAGPPKPAANETAAAAAGPRVNQLIVYGNEACPRSSADEITVCARKPERERYRIPENLRGLDDPKSQTWSSKATELSFVGRTGPESCSTSGPGGFTGCLNQIINAASAERGGRDSVNWNQLIEQARQERLGEIDAKTEAIEQRIKDNPDD